MELLDLRVDAILHKIKPCFSQSRVTEIKKPLKKTSKSELSLAITNLGHPPQTKLKLVQFRPFMMDTLLKLFPFVDIILT